MENTTLKNFPREMKWADEILWELISLHRNNHMHGRHFQYVTSCTSEVPVDWRLFIGISQNPTHISPGVCAPHSCTQTHTQPLWNTSAKMPRWVWQHQCHYLQIALGCFCHFHCSLQIWVSPSPNHTFQIETINQYEDVFSNIQKYTKINL